MKRILLIATALLAYTSLASGQDMTFELVGSGGNCAGCEWIRAEGRITPETPSRFREQFVDVYSGIGVGLHSSGGDLSAALELGRLFREYGIETGVFRSPPSSFDPSRAHDIVIEGAVCESACAYAFLGGQRRSIGAGALLGFHQFIDETAFSETERSVSELQLLIESARDQYVTGLIADYLIEMGIDIRLYPIVAAVEPGMEMRYLTQEEILDFNVDNSRDDLGEWEVHPFGNGLFVEARSSLTNRGLRLFCDATGSHYLNVVLEGRCCKSLTTKDSLRESMALDAVHEQAISRPLSHDELVQLQRVAQEAGVSAHLGRQGHDLARAA